MAVLKKTVATITIFSFLFPGFVAANPLDGQVTAGSANIHQADKVTTINQTSDKAIIDWQQFDLGADELAEFNQPGANSITLNRN